MSKKALKSKKKSTPKGNVPEGKETHGVSGFLKGLTPTVLPQDQYVKNTVLALVFFVLFLFFMLSAFDLGGAIGSASYTWFHGILGYGYYVLPFLFGIQGYFYSIHRESSSFAKTKIFFSVMLLLSVLGILELSIVGAGGGLGELIAVPLLNLLDRTLGYVILAAVLLISLVVLFEYSFGFGRKKEGLEDAVDPLALPFKKETKLRIEGEVSDSMRDIPKASGVIDSIKDTVKDMKKPLDTKEKSILSDIEEAMQGVPRSLLSGKAYVPPPLSLLERDKGKPEVGDIKANANIIKRTLQNFGVLVEMDEISVGPSVTRYALKPAEGVKLSKILGLQDNLSLALAAHPIRIEAPIPGKALVGIEVPNTTKTIVGLGTLLASDEYQKSHSPLLIGLGKGVSGKMFYEDLAKMPHVLIAGTTGSGKSVMIHNLITSLLYKNSPENLRFIFIDPKRVELTLYNKIPHLLTPVITDPKKAILSLKWAGKEMSRRYDILEKCSVRDIDSYHKTILAPAMEEAKKNGSTDAADLPDTMPFIVIVIDELADIMQSYPRELESGIVKLAQMSRAVGIHLVLSTQRPSVNVITGLIKANIPSRFALQVASQIDSRTILDSRGAEELLGKGDMLFMTGRMPNPQRVQSPNITEAETKKIVKHLVDTMDHIPDTIQLGPQDQENAGTNAIFSSSFNDGLGGDDMDDDDDLYGEAKQAVIEAKKASTSYLQRKLRVGYSRAARLMDLLESRGVIGAADGSKPRDVLVGKETQGGDASGQTSSASLSANSLVLEAEADSLLGGGSETDVEYADDSGERVV